MSRTVAAILVLIVLIDFYDSSAASLKVTKEQIRKCRCRSFPSGKIKCRSPLLPKNDVELWKCFCKKANEHKFPEFQAVCRSWISGFPITLV